MYVWFMELYNEYTGREKFWVFQSDPTFEKIKKEMVNFFKDFDLYCADNLENSKNLEDFCDFLEKGGRVLEITKAEILD